ncbi:MAG: bifunctional 4-hydroxy-2-oxoglutarate aldolase/2-dehydro-3-deoxy-phosphogluconate aldolase [Chloroflexales bacterium]
MSTVDLILARRIVAIIRLDDYDRAVEVARALLAGGVPVMEFTLTGAGAMEAITATRRALGAAACVGVGSVLHAEQAAAAIDAGAQFIVTPALRRPVIAACVNRGVPSLCGGVTPTELLDAYESGSELVKLFPARLGGPAYVRDVLAPLPFLKLVPTGGVGAENARAYLDAGAAALGIGGNLVPKAAVASGSFDQITAVARACVAAIA